MSTLKTYWTPCIRHYFLKLPGVSQITDEDLGCGRLAPRKSLLVCLFAGKHSNQDASEVFGISSETSLAVVERMLQLKKIYQVIFEKDYYYTACLMAVNSS
jgi:hypothetical protein